MTSITGPTNSSGSFGVEPLDNRLELVARAPVLLVASDFDGTIAPLVPDFEDAKPLKKAVAALRSLATLPDTHVAIVSGRSLGSLVERSGLAGVVHLVGSHGGEFHAGLSTELSPAALALRERIVSELAEIARKTPGCSLEEKPAGVAMHYRRVEESRIEDLLQAIENGPARLPNVHVRRGKMIVELSVIPANKGDAIAHLRKSLQPKAVVFLGDDDTDEDAFGRMEPADLAVKVGDGVSQASFRIGSVHDVARLLSRLCDLRSEWIKREGEAPIHHHSLLSDQRTAALISPGGRICWYCVPRIDSPPIFAQLLGGPVAGYFDVRPLRPGGTPLQRYVGDTMMLETVWNQIRVLDYMDVSNGRAFQRAGRCELIRVVEGTGSVRIEFAPRLDFGREATKLAIHPEGIEVCGTPDPIVLRAPRLDWTLEQDGPHQTARADVELSDTPLVLELRYGTRSLDESESEARRRELNSNAWMRWSERLQLPPRYAQEVRRSALILRALTYGPTGAISAAATTSLPERIGGVRNWDYRYCWPRDAALSATALVQLGMTGPALKLLDWLLGVLDACESPDRLRPVYTVTGGHLGSEAEIQEISGYARSRPVRIGNAASRQLQLDVFGPIVNLIALLASRGDSLSGEHWRLVEAMVRAVTMRWKEPDHGIWEVRLNPRHWVHSKTMCWLTVDRALSIARMLRGSSMERWEALRDEIAVDVLENGWNSDLGVFTSAYGFPQLDAAALHMGLSGLVKPSDPRFISTVAAVERSLLRKFTVMRYEYDDGLPPGEGGLHLCTSWLIRAFVLLGAHQKAANLLEEWIAQLGPTGLLSEEICPETGQALGNFPQAYSHLGLIEAVLAVTGTADPEAVS